MRHTEHHRNERSGWLRAAVLGANDGLISTSALMMGVAAAGATSQNVLLAGFSGLAAGALSMAAGEYVSVSSQADTMRADTARERQELQTKPSAELAELAGIYEARGLRRELALEVAAALTAHDALEAHLRDELGIVESTRVRPVQAALSSAASFCLGAFPPLLIGGLWPRAAYLIPVSTLALLAVLGGLAAGIGGAPPWRGAFRVTVWGAIAMLATHWLGRAFDVSGLG